MFEPVVKTITVFNIHVHLLQLAAIALDIPDIACTLANICVGDRE